MKHEFTYEKAEQSFAKVFRLWFISVASVLNWQNKLRGSKKKKKKKKNSSLQKVIATFCDDFCYIPMLGRSLTSRSI